MHTFYLQTNCGMIHCTQWLPEGDPVGVVQIIHGINEYVGRYDELARFLTGHGYLVVGEDHPGHGYSVGKDDQFGYLTGGWMGTVKIVHQLCRKTMAEHPGIPYIMLGHSMGSFLLRTYLYTYHDPISAALISGTSWMPAATYPAALLLCREEKARIGERSFSPLLFNLAFGSYNKPFEPAASPYEWICARQEVVDTYADNPFCTWKPSIQLFTEMMKGMQMNQKKVNLAKMRKDLPLFFFAGQLDPVGNMGNGVLQAVLAFKEAGMRDVLVELYPNMRHECHNEEDRYKVFEDILAWIREKTV